MRVAKFGALCVVHYLKDGSKGGLCVCGCVMGMGMCVVVSLPVVAASVTPAPVEPASVTPAPVDTASVVVAAGGCEVLQCN